MNNYTSEEYPEASPVEKLEASQRAIRNLHLPDVMKPCLTAILDLGVDNQRNSYAYALTCELRRVGYELRKAKGIMAEWNENLSRPLPQNEVQGCLKSAYKDTTKNYGCNSELLAAFCVGQDVCFFHKQLKRRAETGSLFEYVSKRWLPILTATQGVIIGIILPMLEVRRQVTRGAWLTVTYREIERYTGYSLRTIWRALHELHEKGLIELKPGMSMKGKHASQIRRILPIPKASKIGRAHV